LHFLTIRETGLQRPQRAANVQRLLLLLLLMMMATIANATNVGILEQQVHVANIQVASYDGSLFCNVNRFLCVPLVAIFYYG